MEKRLTRVSEIVPEKGGSYQPKEWRPVAPKNKPSRDWCKKQIIAKLGGKKNAPFGNDDEPRAKYVLDALVKVAEDEEHVDRILAICERDQYFPDGYTIGQIGYETRGRERAPNPECPKCYGTGHEVVQKRGYSGATKCDCWRVVEVAAS